MTIKKMMMVAGAIDGPQVIAPSSNDWDYSFDGGNEWPVAGNTLGDHTVGAYIDNVGGYSGISSLHTFDGDFEIEFTAVSHENTTFGVFEITEDHRRYAETRLGVRVSGSKAWIYEDKGSPASNFWFGSSAQGSYIYAEPAVVKITRVSGVISFYDDGVLAHEFSDNSSNLLRFYVASNSTNFNQNFDNLLFTDTDKIQRDGMLNESTSGSDSTGDKYAGNAHAGFRFRAIRTGTVTGGTVKLSAVGTAYNSTFGIYTDNGGNPGSLIGSVSGQVTTTAGNNVFTLTGASYVTKGTLYWAVFSDADLNGLGYASIGKLSSGQQDFISGVNDTITSIADTASNPFPFEIKIEATEEPTPDHDTLLLIHSDTSDGSTTFADSSQFGRTVTVGGATDHSTDQAKFGSTSIHFKGGAGDAISVPDSLDWDFVRDFTIELWFYTASTGIVSSIFGPINHSTGNGSWSAYFNGGTIIKFNDYQAGVSSGNVSWGYSASTWHHLAFVRCGFTLKGYLDGVQKTSTSYTTSPITGEDTAVYFGDDDRSGTTSMNFTGYMDEIRISNVARWDAAFTPPTSPYP